MGAGLNEATSLSILTVYGIARSGRNTAGGGEYEPEERETLLRRRALRTQHSRGLVSTSRKSERPYCGDAHFGRNTASGS